MAGYAGGRDVRSHVPDRHFGSDGWGEDHGHSLPTASKQLLLPGSRKEGRGGPEDHSRISTKGSLDQQQEDSARVGSLETTRTTSCSGCLYCRGICYLAGPAAVDVPVLAGVYSCPVSGTSSSAHAYAYIATSAAAISSVAAPRIGY